MMLRLNGFAVAALLAGAIPALAQNNVAVTQGNPLRTPDTGSPEAHGKKMPVYHLEGFSLRGTTRVDTDAIVAALPQHAGDVITNAELREDADKVRQELKASHVHGNISTMILRREGPGHRVWVMWDIQPDDALSYLPMVGVRHFGSQSFFGNTKVSTSSS